MTQPSKKWFFGAMGALRAGFPEMFGGKDDDWRAVQSVWWERFQGFEAEVLQRSFTWAMDTSKRFPNMPQMLEIVRMMDRNRQNRANLPPIDPGKQLADGSLGEYSGMSAEEARAHVREKLGIVIPTSQAEAGSVSGEEP